MSGNITFTIIKPFAVANGHIGPILNMIHEKGLQNLGHAYALAHQGRGTTFLRST